MSIKRTIITTVVVLAMVAVVVPVSSALALTAGCSLSNTTTCNASDLITLVGQLQASLTQLQTAGTGGTGACTGVTFTRNLVVGSTGSDVKCLQQILNQSATTQVAVTGAGSPGNETSYFGPLTLVAVKKYQTVQGFVPANQVGPLTRAKLNAALGGMTTTLPAGCTTTSGFSSTTGASCATGVVVTTTLPAGCTSTAGFSPTTGVNCSTGVVTTSQTGPISAQLASDNPASSAIVNLQARAALLNVNFTGSGTVTSVTLQRSGISDASALSNVYLFDGATRITSGNSFDTNGTLTFNGLNIAVSGSHEISVEGDVELNAAATESSIAVALTSYTANGTTSNASITGNLMSIVTGSLATSNLTTGSSTQNPAPTNVNAGALNQTVWSRNLSIGTRAVSLYGVTVKMVGSAPSNTLANVGLYVDGSLAKTATINSNNQFVFDMSSAPASLTTGSHFLEVRADVIGGAFRNFYISLEQGSDIAVKDPQLGVFISTTASAGTTYSVNGGQISIESGSLTISQDLSFNNTTTLVSAASNVKLASFTITAYGEDTKIMSLTFSPTIGGAGTLQNVGLYVNGGQIGSNQVATSGSNTLVFPNLGSQLIVPVGSPVTVAIYGDVIASGGSPMTTGSVEFDLSSGTAQGQDSSQTVTVPPQGGQSLQVSTSNVNFAASTGFAVTTAAPNSTMVKIGSFTLQTGSAEGVTVNNVALTFPNDGTNTLITGNQLTNLKVMVGSTQIGTPIGQPVITTANNFSTNTVVPISSTTVFDVYADMGSSASGKTVTPWMLVTYRGNTSNTTGYTNSDNPTTGTETTAGAALICGSVNAEPTGVGTNCTGSNSGVTFVPGSSLTAQYVSGNASTTLPIATFNVISENNVGGAVLKDMTFTVGAANTIGTLTVNGVTCSVVSTTATCYNTGIVVPNGNSGVNIPVTATLVPVGSGSSGASGSTVSVEISALTYNDGTTIRTIHSTATSAQLELVASVPTVTLGTPATSNGLGAGVYQIGSFTVAAGSGGDIKLMQVPVTTTYGGGVSSLTNITLEDASGTQIYSTTTASSGANQDIVFNTPRTISHGTSETYYVYADDGTPSFGNSGTTYVTFSLGAKHGFEFQDVAGGTTTLYGDDINGYPTGSQSKTN